MQLPSVYAIPVRNGCPIQGGALRKIDSNCGSDDKDGSEDKPQVADSSLDVYTCSGRNVDKGLLQYSLRDHKAKFKENFGTG